MKHYFDDELPSNWNTIDGNVQMNVCYLSLDFDCSCNRDLHVLWSKILMNNYCLFRQQGFSDTSYSTITCNDGYKQ